MCHLLELGYLKEEESWGKIKISDMLNFRYLWKHLENCSYRQLDLWIWNSEEHSDWKWKLGNSNPHFEVLKDKHCLGREWQAIPRLDLGKHLAPRKRGNNQKRKLKRNNKRDRRKIKNVLSRKPRLSSLQFKKGLWIIDKNLGVINIWVVDKATALDKITQKIMKTLGIHQEKEEPDARVIEKMQQEKEKENKLRLGSPKGGLDQQCQMPQRSQVKQEWKYSSPYGEVL